MPEYQFEKAITFDPTIDRHQIFTGVPDAGFRGVDVVSLLGEAEYSPLQTRQPDPRTFNPIVDRHQIFTGLSGCRFPWSGRGIGTQ